MKKDAWRYLPEEQETFIHWDYYTNELIFYTTREAIYKKFLKLTEKTEGRKVMEKARTISIPLSQARKPWMVLSKKKKKVVTQNVD